MRILIFLLLALPAWGDPKFESVEMPDAHVYSGGWEHFVGGGVAVFDCNDDGLPEILAAGGENPMSFYRNQSSATELIFLRADFPEISGATGAYPLDINSDGKMDVVIPRVGPNRILIGQGACTFKDETFGISFDDKWTTSFSATWENGAELPVLAFGNYVDRTDPDGPFEACDSNELYRVTDQNNYEKTILEPGYCALSMLFSDWNRSGTADLRVSNDRHYYVRGGSEQMWSMPDLTLRDGDGWEPISIWGMGIASQDITGDGRPEVVLTSMGDQLLQIAGENGYSAAPFSTGTYAQRPFIGDDGRPSTGWHAQFADIDNDGLSDLFIAKGNVDQMPGNAMKDPNNLLMQQVSGNFVEKADLAGVATTHRSRGAAVVDLNQDGKLDLVVVNRRAALEVYKNTTDSGNWIAVNLLKKGVNRNAIGSWIEIEAGGRRAVQEVTVGGGHVSGISGPIHFGLGLTKNANLRVIWPDGEISAWRDFEANQTIEFSASDQ